MSHSITRQAFESSPLPLEAIILAQQLVLLPLYFFVPLWIPVFNTLAAAVVLYRHFHPEFQIPRWFKLALTLTAIGTVLVIFRKFSGRDAGIALISAMYGLKIMETKLRRDANLLMSLGFFLIVSGFLFSQKPWIAIYQFVPVLAILNAFLAMQTLQKFRFGADSFTSLIKNLGRYLLIALPIMVVLFIFFPRLSGPLWHMPGSKSAVSGLSDVMGLTEVGNLQLSDEVAFRVSFKGQPPAETEMYWRVLVLDQFDGLTWSRRGRSPIADQTDLTQLPGVVNYSITLEPTQLNYLISLDRPLTSPANGMLIDDFVVYSKFRILDRTRYTMASAPALAIDTRAQFSANSIYLALPKDSNNRSRQWAVDMRNRVNSDEAFIGAVLQQINQQPYYYTLSPGVMDEPVIDSFWFNKRRGFCEHYASSLAFLSRAAGIPARVVVGYQGGEKNPISDYWIVRQARAHAWTEIWLQGRGWVRIDPTAAIARERIEPNLLLEYSQRQSLFDNFDVVELDDLGFFKEFQYWLDQMDNRWNDWILDYNSQRQQQLFDFWGLENITRQQLYIGMIVAVALLLMVASGRWFYQINRRDPLAHAYMQMLNKIVSRNLLDFNQLSPKAPVPDRRESSNAIVNNIKSNNFKPSTIGPMALCDLMQQANAVYFQQHIEVIRQYIQLRYAQASASPVAKLKIAEALKAL